MDALFCILQNSLLQGSEQPALWTSTLQWILHAAYHDYDQDVEGIFQEDASSS